MGLSENHMKRIQHGLIYFQLHTSPAIKS